MERINNALKAYQNAKKPLQEEPFKKDPEFITQNSDQNEPKDKKAIKDSKEKKKLNKSETNLKKVAQFLVLLGKDEAAKVVRHLDESQIEQLSLEIAKIRSISPKEAEKILGEFGYIAKASGESLHGGKKVAQEILVTALGEDRSKIILNKVVPTQVDPPFNFLNDLDKTTVSVLLASESLMVLGIVVPFLKKDKAGYIIKTLSPKIRIDLIKRLAKIETVPREIVVKVEEVLKDKLSKLGTSGTEEMDGKSRLADILKYMPMDKEEEILKNIGENNPELSENLHRRIFTTSWLLKLRDEDFEELLRFKDDIQIALIWKAGDESLRNKIKNNISSRRMALVEAELDLMVNSPLKEAQDQLRAFLDEVRQRVRDGEVGFEDEDWI